MKEYQIDETSPTGLSKKGKPIGYMDNCGYYRTGYKGKTYLVHRIIWHLHTGKDFTEFPVLDHINRVRDDNRVENLREVTKAENNRNRPPGAGVSFCKQTGRWKAYKGVKWLGRFDTEAMAKEAVCDQA